MPTRRHPRVSKKHCTFESLAPLSPTLKTAFWEIDGRLRVLNAVTVVYLGKGLVRYHDRGGRFVEAKIGQESIQWRYSRSGEWKAGGQLGTVEMLATSDPDKIFDLLRQAHVDVG